MRPIGSQRPSASAAAGVYAAASSAAARSRATSPANMSAGLMSGSELGGTPMGMLGLGTSFNSHPFRLENSSSPSFVSALSHTHTDYRPNSSLSHQRDAAGTPKLVIEGFQSSGSMTEEGKRDDAFPSFLSTHGDGSSNGDIQSPLSPTGSASAALASITAHSEQRNGQNGQKSGYPFPTPPPDFPRQASIQRILPHRSDTAGSANSGGSGRAGNSSPAPYLALPNSSTSSHAVHSGLLSPTAATMGSVGPPASTSTFSPFGSPLRATQVPTSSETGRPEATVGELDAQLHTSPFLLDILDRLVRVETSVRDINRNISGLSRNVSLLLDRTKNVSGSSNSNTPSQRSTATLGQHNYNQQAQQAGASTQMASEDARALNAQIALLSTQVSQLMSQSGSSAAASFPMVGSASNVPLAGLGLGGATPQFAASNFILTPQLGTLPGTPHFPAGTPRMNQLGGMSDSPRASMGNFGPSQQNSLGPMDRNSRLSPRPGASPGPSSRRWSSMVPGAQDLSAQGPNGAMNPPDPSVIVTKWEHLNLHQDLLRCILKYGLGPPNKIQQRALPFLLRGSDIIAQAPPTQERIASYVIPVLQLVLNVLRGEPMPSQLGVRGPIALIISTTVDQATQAQRMALGLGSALGVRVHIAAASSLDVSQEATGLIQTQPQIVVGTPQKMMDLFNYLANKTKGAISLEDIRMVVLDEVDQLIARNLADYVSTLLRILPQPRMIQLKDPRSPSLSPGLPPTSGGTFSPFEAPMSSQATLAEAQITTTDRQTAIFSNTVPQDVLNFAQSIHLRESVRVLVRREGGGQGLPSASGGNSGGGGMGALGTSHSNLSASSALSLGASAGQAHPQYNQPATPVNVLGASPGNNNLNPMADPVLSSLRGLRQYYLYVAVSTGGNSIGGLQSPHPSASQVSHAMEMKLDVITDLLEDIDFGQAVIYTSSSATHEAVTYKLASKGIDALGLHKDMANITRQQVLAKYRSNSSTSSGLNYHAAGNQIVGSQLNNSSAMAPTGGAKHTTKRALVVYDVVVNPKEVHQVPLIVFYDLPRSVEEYKEKISCAASGGIGRPSVCVNVVTGSGGPRGDIEMLRTLECHLGCKMAELPMNPSQILNF